MNWPRMLALCEMVETKYEMTLAPQVASAGDGDGDGEPNGCWRLSYRGTDTIHSMFISEVMLEHARSPELVAAHIYRHLAEASGLRTSLVEADPHRPPVWSREAKPFA